MELPESNYSLVKRKVTLVNDLRLRKLSGEGRQVAEQEVDGINAKLFPGINVTKLREKEMMKYAKYTQEGDCDLSRCAGRRLLIRWVESRLDDESFRVIYDCVRVASHSCGAPLPTRSKSESPTCGLNWDGWNSKQISSREFEKEWTL